MSSEFSVDPHELSRVIHSLRSAADSMGNGANAAPQVPDAGSSTYTSADALSKLLETSGGATQAVHKCAEQLTEVRDTYSRGDENASETLSRIDPR